MHGITKCREIIEENKGKKADFIPYPKELLRVS